MGNLVYFVYLVFPSNRNRVFFLNLNLNLGVSLGLNLNLNLAGNPPYCSTQLALDK
jgi:hypothetical protein